MVVEAVVETVVTLLFIDVVVLLYGRGGIGVLIRYAITANEIRLPITPRARPAVEAPVFAVFLWLSASTIAMIANMMPIPANERRTPSIAIRRLHLPKPVCATTGFSGMCFGCGFFQGIVPMIGLRFAAAVGMSYIICPIY